MLPIEYYDLSVSISFPTSKTCHDYSPIMSLLNLKPLEDRRLVVDLCLLHEIINARTNSSPTLALINSNAPLESIRKPLLFQYYTCPSISI